MSVLLLRLAGPMQAWGAASRYSRRETRHEPTKSGIIGLLAAAQGRRRTDSIEDLAQLRFGVRIDQPGQLLRDFQTARTLDGTQSMPLSYRFYISDAVFLAAVEGNDNVLEGLDAALRNPTFPLYLGRRSCPPSGPPSLGIVNGTLDEALRQHPWQASPWYRRKQAATVALPIIRDAIEASEPGELVRDTPVSFNPERREYGWRNVIHDTPVTITNPGGHSTHDPMSVLGGT